jgi:hypothetical protein
MPSTAASQLLSANSGGAIDQGYLSGQPDSTLFQCSQNQITPFARGHSCQALTGGQKVGQKTTSIINREGDLLAGISVRAILPGLDGGKYVKRPAQQLIKEVQLKIGGVSVECLSGDFIMMWDMLSAKAGKEASERHGGNQDAKHARGDKRHEHVQECIVDLPMWFCASKNGGEYCYALNLNGMSLHKVEIALTLNSAASIIVPDGAGAVKVRVGESASDLGKPKRGVLGAGDKVVDDGDIQVDLIHEFIYLGDEERQMMADASSETVIVTHQSMSSKTSTSADLSTQLYFNGAINELIFAIRDPSKKDKADLSGRLQNDKSVEPLLSAQLKLNNANAFGGECINGKVSGQFLRLKSGESHSRTPDAADDEFVYSYAFALDPENWGQYSGSVNMSRIDNVVLETTADNDGASYELLVFARSMNVLRMTNGMAGVKYST